MTYVLGIGNVLMGDDGFGPAVVRAFDAEYFVGGDVEVVDIGTPGLDLMPWLVDADRVVIADTVKNDAAPGTVKVYEKAEILQHAPSVRVGPHDPGMKEALFALDFAGRGPREVVLIGVTPSHVAMGLDLTPAVCAAVPAAMAAIAAALERFGHIVRHRQTPTRVTPWWAVSASAQ